MINLTVANSKVCVGGCVWMRVWVGVLYVCVGGHVHGVGVGVSVSVGCVGCEWVAVCGWVGEWVCVYVCVDGCVHGVGVGGECE